jgi:hypothetical protein
MAKLGGLAILDLQGNDSVGEISDSIGQLHSLKELHLGYNKMRGYISKVNFSGLHAKSGNFGSYVQQLHWRNLGERILMQQANDATALLQ